MPIFEYYVNGENPKLIEVYCDKKDRATARSVIARKLGLTETIKGSYVTKDGCAVRLEVFTHSVREGL